MLLGPTTNKWPLGLAKLLPCKGQEKGSVGVSERVFKITSMFVMFITIFALRAYGSEEIKVEKYEEQAKSEIQQAVSLAQEIQALNRGDFDSHKGPYHPNHQLRLDDSTLSLSVKRN